jgi:CDP-diacylglycerol--glycerol-3-phosphate 3-phosphatidyltransferase
LTILGFILSLAIAYLLAMGKFFPGGLLVLFYGWFDMLDGALALASGRSTKFGALLDSTLDRLGEAALLCGLLVFYALQGSLQEILLLFAILVGSVMVSYIRARAEGLGIEVKVGLFTRPQRVIILAIGLILGAFFGKVLLVFLWILAVGTIATAIHRLYYVWQRTREGRE